MSDSILHPESLDAINTKTCIKCKRNLPVTCFSKHKREKDGLQWWCKECVNEYDKTYVEKPDALETKRLYRVSAKNKARQKRYYTSEKGLLAAKNNRERHVQERVARSEVYKAVLRGDMIKPDSCAQCNEQRDGKNKRIEAHHYLGYEPEHWLDVIWLCTKCHRSGAKK